MASCSRSPGRPRAFFSQHNQLTKLERGAFGRLPVVFELNLAHNLLSNVTSRAFEGLLQLLTLNLTANNLTTIPNGAFQGEPHQTAIKSNSTKSPATGAGNVSELKLMSQVGTVREVVCA